MPFLATAPTKPLTPYQEQIREELNRTEAINVTAEQVDLKSALDTLVVEGFALPHSFPSKPGEERVYCYEPKVEKPEAFVPWPMKLYGVAA